MTKPLCIYHHPCTDGFAAAWVIRKFFGDGNVDFVPAAYGDLLPDVTDRSVIIVDYSYKRDALIQLAGKAKHILVIDHHESAQRELVDLPDNVRTEFDMNRSGSMLTWDTFFPMRDTPPILKYIQDRDLWRFNLDITREVTAALFSYPYDFVVWDILFENDLQALVEEGEAIIRKHRKDVESLVRDATRWMYFGETLVPVANVPYIFASDVGAELAIGVPFAATYHDDATGRRWSLRSAPNGADVSRIAEAFGGGGHKHAAGFRQTLEEAIDFELASMVTA